MEGHITPEPSGAWIPPREFEEYRLVRALGRGAMGEVWLAHDRLLDRPVAIKFIAAVEPGEAARQRFFVEARAIARLQHPNVVAIHRVGQVRGRPYLVSEFVRGVPLDRLPLPLAPVQLLDAAIGLARGLAAAHRAGVLHRDIKPANAILGDGGEPKLLDFGLAKLLDDDVPGAMPHAGLRESFLIPLDNEGESRSGNAGDGAATRSVALRISPTRAAAGKAVGTSDATEDSGAIGTPLYMAPELWRGDAATQRSDVYSLGALLYELGSGGPPLRGTPLGNLPRAAQNNVTPLRERAPTIDGGLAAVIDRCLAAHPAARFASGDAVREALELLAARPPGWAVPEGAPYRGLHSFEADHRALFFGRNAEVRTILDRLRAEPFVLVAGDSGVGKSSLCCAGVVPLVAQGALGGGRWQTARMVPGRHPLAALANAVAPLLDDEEAAIATSLRDAPRGLARELRRRQRADGETLLFVDQLEELLTISEPGEAAVVAETLSALAEGMPGVRLLATVRSDFLTRLGRLPGMIEAMTRALYLVPPLSTDGLREAVVGPARAKGYSFESPELVDALVESAVRDGSGLPLLQFALAELWDLRDEKKCLIPAAALVAIGGVSGALARHADGVIARLPPTQREAARRILIRLVTAEGTRARKSDRELLQGDDDGRAALEALVRGRLLVARESEERESGAYELAHEALLSAWGTLRSWLAGDVEARAARQRLEQAAVEWERLGRRAAALWSRPQLVEVARLIPADLLPREGEFLAASRRAVERRRNSLVALALGVPLLLGLTYGGVRLQNARRIDREIGLHRTRASAALAEGRELDTAVIALRRESFALFDAQERTQAEDKWRQVIALGARADQTYSRASQSLESALVLDGTRADARSLLGDVLYERALHAERDARDAQLDEIMPRLSLYDGSDRWNRSAALVAESSPPSSLTIERYRNDPDGTRTPVSIATRRTPVEQSLDPGSYVLTFSAAGFATVRYPIVLHRGERLPLTVELPKVDAVPEGYAYVPAGRFLFGSRDDEATRSQFFNTAPLHEVNTGAYLIARHETTFGDWIEFLHSLPPGERSHRTPRVNAAFEAVVDLVELPGGDWRITLKPKTRPYTARLGEAIRYPGRTLRSSQDWLRLPVVGISSEDAAAYAAWLDRTGRVPGARLCDEFEWERAARGADDRDYPHGDRLAPDDANHDATYGRDPLGFGPDEVGSHPASRSPFGVDDLAGNVFEWTRSRLAPRELVVRGGCFNFDTKSSRAANREVSEPSLRDIIVGIRVCASYPPR